MLEQKQMTKRNRRHILESQSQRKKKKLEHVQRCITEKNCIETEVTELDDVEKQEGNNKIMRPTKKKDTKKQP